MDVKVVTTMGLFLTMSCVFADELNLEFLAGVEAGIDTDTAMSNTDLNRTQEVLSSQPLGVTNSWYNIETLTLYNIRIGQYYSQNKQTCVSYDLVIKHKTKLDIKQLNACKNTQGNWIAKIDDTIVM